MSLSNILQHVKRKGQIIPKTNQSGRDGTPETNRSAEQLNNKNQYRYSNGETKTVDPVVARLKAARKLEREKKEQEAREKKGLAPKKPKSVPRNTNTNSSRSNEVKKNNGVGRMNNSNIPSSTSMRSNVPPSHKPVKKMNFNDLMKKASKIDQSKLSVSIKPKAKSPDARPTTAKHKPLSRASSAPTEGYRNVPKRKEGRPATSKHPNSDDNKPSSRAPLPVRKPSTKLEERLKSSGKTKPSYSRSNRSHSYNDSEDEYSESFIVSDEEEADYGNSNAPDYDRDEIWAIFNRGKKRSYYDRYDNDDSGDDMEATGAEIWEEEMRSKRNAELEDRKELEEEQRLAALKKARKMKQR
ncbi:unnamed protein product [Debaryomyces tyrocola]|nr:unnamed protein product [Debaryomyces tyrocola]